MFSISPENITTFVDIICWHYAIFFTESNENVDIRDKTKK